MAKAAPKIDGRTQRAERSRVAIAEAMLDLMREGKVQPTAAEVAARAGVSPRLVFHHFSDMDAVHQEAMRLQSEHVLKIFRTISPAKPFEERLSQFVEDRSALLEEITSVRRGATVLAMESKQIADGLNIARRAKRDQVASAFKTELDAYVGAERAERQAALQMVTAWTAWETLRAHQGLSLESARKIMRRSICLVLGVPLPS